MRPILGQRSRWSLALAGAGLVLLSAACSQGVPREQVEAKDQEIAQLKAQLADMQKTATYWGQLTSLMKPVELPTMSDHRATMTDGGIIVATHFDNHDLKQAQNLNWIAVGLPGKFCKQDQERLEQAFGKGFTHFHDLKNDTHGGKPGAEGVWFMHIAVREFEAPWGQVQPGVDQQFMPTPPPTCS